MNPADPHRPSYHYTPARNWINDPNGLVFFDGEYHLFYQYNPFGDQWGHMSWGHAVSTDLVDWQELPVAIAEDERASIFSGSVVVDTHNSSGFGDGRKPPLVAIYTGCLRREAGGQAQELAFSTDRGRTWTKYTHNPVLDLGLRDFRDPKVFWHAGTARWVMVVVLSDDRKAQFYGSADLKAWTLLSEFEAPFEDQGIWECPDLLRLPVADGQPGDEAPWFFKVDVFGGHPSGGTGARIFFGHFDGTRLTADAQTAPQWADLGADFYAALSWSGLPAAADGTPQRALWLAWMNCHRYAKHLPTSPWRGAMSVPRELRARRTAAGWQLLQQPVPELQRLRVPLHSRATMVLHDEVRNVLATGRAPQALDIAWQVTACHAGQCGLRLRIGEGEYTEVGYAAARGVVYVDRAHSGFQPPGDTLYARRHEVAVPAPGAAQPLRLRLLLDACLLELYVGDGEATISEQLFPHPDSNGLQAFARGGRATLTGLQVHAMMAAGSARVLGPA